MSELAPPPEDPITIDAAIKIEEIRKNGVPPIGTPERAQYMRLFRRKPPEPEPEPDVVTVEPDPIVAQIVEKVYGPEPMTVAPTAPVLTDEVRSEIARLYADPTIPMAEIRETYGIQDRYVIERIAKEAGVPNRTTVLKEKRRASYEQREVRPVTTPPPRPRPRLPSGLWSVTYTIRRTEVVSADSITDAINQVHQHQGDDVNIVGAVLSEAGS